MTAGGSCGAWRKKNKKHHTQAQKEDKASEPKLYTEGPQQGFEPGTFLL